MAIVNVTLQNLRHDVGEVAEKLPEVVAEQATCHVKALLAIVVAIVLVDDTERTLDKLVGHVAQEERLLVNAIRQDRDMR